MILGQGRLPELELRLQSMDMLVLYQHSYLLVLSKQKTHFGESFHDVDAAVLFLVVFLIQTLASVKVEAASGKVACHFYDWFLLFV